MHGRCDRLWGIQFVSFASTTLVPFDNGEIVDPRSLEQITVRQIRRGGTTVQHQQDWIVSIASAHGDPLANAADLHRLRLVDSVGGNDLAHFRENGVRVRWRLCAYKGCDHRDLCKCAGEDANETFHSYKDASQGACAVIKRTRL